MPEFIFVTPIVIPEQKNPDAGPYQPNCNEPKNSEDGNFCQQRRAAKAGEDAARAGEYAATIANNQLSLSYWGFGGLVLTVIFTAWAAHAASRAASSAANSAEISDRTLREVQSTARRQLRAYVDVIGVIRTKNPDGDGFGAAIMVKNSGLTPATNLSQWAKIDLREMPLQSSFPLYCRERDSLGVIAPDGQTLSIPVFLRDLTPLEEQALRQNGKAIYVYGEIDYTDVFGDQHRSIFRFRCNGQGYGLGTFKADCEGNEST
jgi:hypothetical protein